MTGAQREPAEVNRPKFEALELTCEGAAGGFLLGGDAKDRLGSSVLIKWVACPSLPTGTAVLSDWGSAKPIVREETTWQADGSGFLFDTNQVKRRAEGRSGSSVTRPEAFAVVSLGLSLTSGPRRSSRG